jgi:hypothetical protein
VLGDLSSLITAGSSLYKSHFITSSSQYYTTIILLTYTLSNGRFLFFFRSHTHFVLLFGLFWERQCSTLHYLLFEILSEALFHCEIHRAICNIKGSPHGCLSPPLVFPRLLCQCNFSFPSFFFLFECFQRDFFGPYNLFILHDS